jgi:hypothetical protein
MRLEQCLFDIPVSTLPGYSSIYGNYHKTVSEAYNNLGVVEMKISLFGTAVPRFKMALSRLPASGGSGLAVCARSDMAIVYKLQGNYLGSIELYEEVV